MAVATEQPVKKVEDRHITELKDQFALRFPQASKILVRKVNYHSYRVNVFVEEDKVGEFIKSQKITHSEFVTVTAS